MSIKYQALLQTLGSGQEPGNKQKQTKIPVFMIFTFGLKRYLKLKNIYIYKMSGSDKRYEERSSIVKGQKVRKVLF